ncbi:MAG: response regulator [Desulfuromonadaceae bacterium]
MQKVYIIDDDRDIVESMKMILEGNGYAVEAQYDGENVVENLKSANPALIILDVMFPEDSSAGFSIAKTIKNDDALAEIPIIMLSAINEKGIYVGKFSDKDIDDLYLPINMFVEKPINAKSLLGKIEEVLKKA